jgi:hypothetical protein
VVLVRHAYALGVFFELAGVVGAGEEVLKKMECGTPIRFRFRMEREGRGC